MNNSARFTGFTEDNIYALFGNEAAETEDLSRLREYYFKSTTYSRIVSQVPLRILVGHKGIGKSALFKVAMAEDSDAGHLAVLIRPDDIASIKAEGADFLAQISDWKNGLIEIISHKILESLGIRDSENSLSKITWYTGQVVSTLIDTIKSFQNQVSLNKVAQKAIPLFLEKQTIVIYIDDLDRGWEGRPTDTKRISALLNAVRDLGGENKGIRFRVALRSDVYFLYRTSDESTDKVDGSVIWFSWTNHEILILLAKRIETYFGRSLDDEYAAQISQSKIAEYLNPIIDPIFHGRGSWREIPTYRVLMSLIRKRPRDLVKLCTLAASKACESGASRIGTPHFNAVLEEYSQGRIQDTINEYRSELKDVERLIINMRPTTKQRDDRVWFQYTEATLLQKLRNVMQTGQFRFANGVLASDKDLAAFLYKINFLTARKDLPDGEIQRKYFEENRYLRTVFTDFGYSWEVHPAYRWALQPDGHLGAILDGLT